jgi:hypothetical protein
LPVNVKDVRYIVNFFLIVNINGKGRPYFNNNNNNNNNNNIFNCKCAVARWQWL